MNKLIVVVYCYYSNSQQATIPHCHTIIGIYLDRASAEDLSYWSKPGQLVPLFHMVLADRVPLSHQPLPGTRRLPQAGFSHDGRNLQGFSKPRLRTGTVTLSLHPNGQNNSQGQPRFKGQETILQSHTAKGKAAGTDEELWSMRQSITRVYTSEL